MTIYTQQIDIAPNQWANIGVGPLDIQWLGGYGYVNIIVAETIPAIGDEGFLLSAYDNKEISVTEAVAVWAFVPPNQNNQSASISIMQTNGSAGIGGGGSAGSGSGSVTIVSDANGSIFWCSVSVSNGVTTYSYQPLPTSWQCPRNS